MSFFHGRARDFVVSAQAIPPPPRPDGPLRPMPDDRISVTKRDHLFLAERYFCFACLRLVMVVRQSTKPRFGPMDRYNGACEKHRSRSTMAPE